MLTGEIHIEINLNKRCSYETVLSSGQELTKQRVKNKSMMLNNNEEKDRSGDNISSSTHLIMYWISTTLGTADKERSKKSSPGKEYGNQGAHV